MSVDQPKTIYVHLTELRNRLVKVALCFVVFFIACYEFSIKLQNIFIQPLSPILKQGRSLVYTSLPEAFFSEINVTLFASLLLTFPFFLIQAWLFLRPGLFKAERHGVYSGFVLHRSGICSTCCVATRL